MNVHILVHLMKIIFLVKFNENLERKNLSSMANPSKILYLILLYEIVTFC